MGLLGREKCGYKKETGHHAWLYEDSWAGGLDERASRVEGFGGAARWHLDPQILVDRRRKSKAYRTQELFFEDGTEDEEALRTGLGRMCPYCGGFDGYMRERGWEELLGSIYEPSDWVSTGPDYGVPAEMRAEHCRRDAAELIARHFILWSAAGVAPRE